MMKFVVIAFNVFLLISCDNEKQRNDNDAEIPYWGDSAVIHFSGNIDGTKATVYLDGIEPDSLCVYHRFIVNQNDVTTEWNEYCSRMLGNDSQYIAFFVLDSLSFVNHRNAVLDYYAIAWIDGEPYRSKDQWTYGGFETHFNDDTLYQYDSTRPLVFPDSMECNQAIALFLTWNVNNKKEYWTDGVKCLGLVDRACLPYEGNKAIDPTSCVIEFEGTYNDAATQLERNAPSAFITLYPWCEGLKRCGGGQPPI